MQKNIMYMAVTYRDDGFKLVVQQGGYTNDAGRKMGNLEVLLQWHLDDPVDEFERNRNEVIYSYQGNRNPFIDYPEFVSIIWGTTPSATYEPFTSQSNVLLTNIIQDDIVMYDNRSSMYIN